MARPPLYRNIRARDQLELFLVASISSVLLVRFYLSVTGYPVIGNSTLHVAHVLWGGVLMMAALVIALSFLGHRAQRLTALIGGIGFGMFIDEIGKFLTQDNDYFFRPAVGIIYAIFAILYLTFNFMLRSQKFSSREYQLNALAQLEEAISHNMDAAEKAEVAHLLSRANPKSPLTQRLKEMLESVRTIPPLRPSRFHRGLAYMDIVYQHFWELRSSHRFVRAFFLVVTFLFLIGVIAPIYNTVDDVLDIFSGGPTYAQVLLVGELASAALAACYVLWGTVILRRSHQRAFEQFRRATLINIFLTEFFIFSREQFAAMPGFVFNLMMLGLINFVLHREARIRRKQSAPS